MPIGTRRTQWSKEITAAILQLTRQSGINLPYKVRSGRDAPDMAVPPIRRDMVHMGGVHTIVISADAATPYSSGCGGGGKDVSDMRASARQIRRLRALALQS